MGDTGMITGLTAYLVFLNIILVMNGSIGWEWGPNNNWPGGSSDVAEDTKQSTFSNAFECAFHTIGTVTVSTFTLGILAIPATERLIQVCKRDTIATEWRSVDSFFDGLSTVVDAVFAAFSFMIAALNVFWQLVTLQIPGPPLLHALLVWVPMAALGFLLYRQVRGVGG